MTVKSHKSHCWLSTLAILALLLGMLPAASHAAPAAGSMPVAQAAPPLHALAGQEVPDNQGREFWLAFPGNYDFTSILTLFITGQTATTGTVTIPGTGFTQDFSVTPGDITSVVVPTDIQIITSDTVETKGIHVLAQAEVTVYGLNRVQYTTDAYLGLPVDVLGTEYLALNYTSNGSTPEQFTIVASEDGATVTITPTVTVGGRTAGVPYTVALDEGQTYQLQLADTTQDLSGSVITSDKPIAVYGGVNCANIPLGYMACDHIVEQLPPVASWGKAFVTVPLATRTKGDTFRFLAARDGTTITFEGADVGTPTVTLNRGEWHERLIASTAYIVSSEPILIAQYSNGTTFDGVTSDPFMMLIPPYEQFGANYTVSTPAEGFITNYINVVAPAAAVGSVILDGAAIPAGDFSAIGSSGFYGAQAPVALGTHNLSGPLPFGVFSYGFDEADSYGYPGGMGMAAVANVATLTITLPAGGQAAVGDEYCLTALTADAEGDPVNGVRVDFAVTGVNPTTGFTTTNQAGEAPFCYTGMTAGEDTVVGAVGTVSDTATIMWSESAPSALALGKTAEEYRNTPPLLENDQILYTIRVTNTTTGALTNLVVTDTLPTGVTYFGIPKGSPRPDQTGNPVVWTLDSLAAGQTQTFKVIVKVDGSANPIGVNQVQATCAEETTVAAASAQVPGDGVHEPGLVVTGTVGGGGGTMAQVTRAPASALDVGDLLTYTVMVTNSNDSLTLHNLAVTVTLPSGVEWVRMTPAGSTALLPVLVWHQATLGPGMGWRATIVVSQTSESVGTMHIAAASDEQSPVEVTIGGAEYRVYLPLVLR